MALNNNNNDTSCKCTTPEYEIVLNEQGPQGRQGNQGDAGFTPIISVKDNTDNNYTLNILTQDGQITTPNLKANLPAGGATGQVLTKNSANQDDCSWQNLPNATTEVEGIARLATPSDFEATEDSEVSNTSIVTPALFNTELTKQVQNFIVAGNNITTSVDEEGKVTINAEAEPYTLPQANATTLGGVKANPTTDEDTQAVNIDPATGLLYTKAGGGGLLPATKDSLGGIIVGDGLKVDEEGLTSLDISVQQPLSLVGDIPANPHIESGTDGKGYLNQDVIAFTPANGSTPTNNFTITDSVLNIKNRTNGELDWTGNLIEIPYYVGAGNDKSFSLDINHNYTRTGVGTRYNLVGTLYCNRSVDNNITPKLFITNQCTASETGPGSKTKTNIYTFNDNGSLGDDNISTNYNVTNVGTEETELYALLGGTRVMRYQIVHRDTNSYSVYIAGNKPLSDGKWFNPDTANISHCWYIAIDGIGNFPSDEINCIFAVFAPGNAGWYNNDYPLLAEYTGNMHNSINTDWYANYNTITQHYVEVSPVSGKPILSLNIDDTTITTNSEGQLQANIPGNITTQGNTFNGASQLVQLDSTGKLPAIDGSQLTNLPSYTKVETDDLLDAKVNASDMVEVPVVIEQSDKSLMPSWYRVWSNGWIEQGGQISVTNTTTVNLLKPYTQTNYLPNTQAIGQSTGNQTSASVSPINVNSFSITSSTSTAQDFNWYCVGY